MAIRVFHVDRDYVEIPSLSGQGTASRVVIWPGMGARKAAMHYAPFVAGQKSVPHQHPNSEDVYYIVHGEGHMVEWKDDKEVSRQPIGPGNFVLVEPGTVHQLIATTDLLNVGGPQPPDIELYKRLGLLK
jgi:mannose-6-phosphate isomerase-like protein (cupin superfamily)